MKKCYAILLAMLMFGVAAQAQITELPYTADFEDGLGQWTAVDNDGDGHNWYQTTNAAHGGSGSLTSESYASTALSPDNFLISPAITLSGDNLTFSYWIRTQSSYYPAEHIAVYVVTDTAISAITATEPVEEYTLTAADVAWTKHSNSLAEYEGQTVYFVFRHYNCSDQYNLYLDDVTVGPVNAPELTLFAPEGNVNAGEEVDFHVTTIGDLSSMTYTWTSTMATAGNATMSGENTSALTIVYSAAGTDTVTIVVTNSYGSDSATTTINVVNITTVTELPYSTGFEEGDDLDWTFFNDTPNAWYIGTAAKFSGENGLYISNDNGATNGYDNYSSSVSFAFRAFQFADSGDYSYSYDWRCVGETTKWDYVDVWLADNYNVTAGNSIKYSTPYGWMHLCNTSSGVLHGESTWQNESGIFHIDSACTKYLIFVWENDSYSSNSPLAGAIDNISIAQLNCTGINGLAASDITTNSVTLTWTGHDETEWAISVNGGEDSIVNTTTVTIEGLTPATDYNIRVRAICGPMNESFPSVVTFRTECLPFDEYPINLDFEDMPDDYNTSVFVPCWIKGSNYVSSWTTYPYVSSDYNTGNKYLYFYSDDWYTPAVYSYIILPETAISVDSLEVSFDIYSNNYGIVVGTIDTTDYVDGVAIDTVGVYMGSTSNVWETFYVDFSGHPGQRIIFITDAAASYSYPYIDNISIYPIPSCKSPNKVRMTNVSYDEMTLAWNTNGTGVTNFDVAYRPTDSIDAEWMHVAATDSSVTINDLEPFTQYTFRIRAICGEGDTSFAKIEKFTTLCAPLDEFPYYEGFESGMGCWGTVSNSDYTGDDWTLDTYSYDSHLGMYCTESYSNYDGPTDGWLISQQFVIPEENTDYFSLIFWASYNYYGTPASPLTPILVLVNNSSSAYDLSGYTDTLFAIPYTTMQGGDYWRKYCVNISQYAGQTVSFAFVHYGENTTSCYLDDIEIRESKKPEVNINGDEIADLNYLETFGSTLTEGSTEGLTYTWTSTMQAAGNATVSGASTPTLNITYTTLGTDTLRLVATNVFGSDTTYLKVTVRNLNPAELPYKTGFEDDNENANWALLNTSAINKWYIGEAVSCTGNKSLYISDDDGVSNHYTQPSNYQYIYAVRAFNFPDTGTYYVAYDWRGDGGNYGEYMYTYLMYPHQVVEGNNNYINGSYMSLTNGNLSQSANWTSAAHVFQINQPGIYQIVFYGYVSDYNAAVNPPTAVDNVEVGLYTCPEPKLVGADNITDTSAVITWTAGGQEQQWMVTIGDNAPVIVTTPSYTATGLDQFTVYTVKVRAICGAGDTSFASSASFRTLCTPIIDLPWVEDFEGYEVSQQSNNYSNPVYFEQEISCWTHMGGDLINIFKNNRDTARNMVMAFNPLSSYTGYGSTPVYFLNSSVMTLPEFYPTIMALEMDVYIAPSDAESGKLEIGYLTDPGNIMSFTGLAQYNANDPSFLDTATNNMVFLKKHVNFSTAPDGARIAFRRTLDSADANSYKDYYWYVDSVAVKVIDGVDPYFCADPDSIWQANATENIVVVDWTSSADNHPTETKWEVKISSEDAPRIVTSHPYVFNGLEADHEYTVQVRALCNRHAESDWSTEVRVRTLAPDTNNTGIYSSSAVAFGLYPNPASSTVTLDMSNLSNATVAIIDMNGRKADEWKVNNDKLTVDVSKYARGAYFVKVTSAEGTAVRKLVIQ